MVSFLFGAGVSIPGGLPNTEEITRAIQQDPRVYLHTNSNFYFKENDSEIEDSKHIDVIRKYLLLLNEYWDKYYREMPVKKINYEDLYYMALQIHQSLIKDVDNPALLPFEEEIIPVMKELVKPLVSEIRDWNYEELAQMTVDYIHDVVFLSLAGDLKTPKYLEFLKEAIDDPFEQNANIFTLNHDKLVDNYLSGLGIEYVDGFGDEVNRMRWWSSDWRDNEKGKTKLIKLHGSIDWYLMNINPDRKPLGQVGIPLDWDHWHATNPEGKFIRSLEHRPLILVGTFNKMFRYSDDIFAELYYYFLATLRNTQGLIVSGYSFGDRGINNAIVRWLLNSAENHLVLVEPNYEGLKARARYAITSRLDEWLASGKLRLVDKGIEQTNWYELKNLLN